MPFSPLAPFKTQRRVAVSQVSRLLNTPPPTGGLNLRDPISEMSPLDAVVLNNMIPRQQGVEIRKGWRYFSSESSGSNFKSVFGYNAPSGVNNKVFAAHAGVIYDVTSGTPTVAVAASGSTNGQWWTTQFTTSSGTYLLAVSPGAGYWTYDSTGGWVNRTSSTVGLPTTVRTVGVWKKRIWFTDSTGGTVYYMRAVDAIQGHADAFEMGSTLQHGGYVSSVLNWTIDAGYGIDDYLIVIGTEGDVSVWKGTDPSSINTFELAGVWYVGPVPRYGRYFTSFGGDVMILSEQGLVPMSKVISGQWNEAALNNTPASKIQTTLSPLVNQYKNSESWDVIVVPSESVLIIKCPVSTINQYVQFVMNVVTGAWSTFTGIPMSGVTLLDGTLYFGTSGGRVAKAFLGDTDGQASNGTGGNVIEAEVQQAFNDFRSPGNLKKFQLARPIFLAANAPSVLLQLNTQYGTATAPGSPSFSPPTGAIWNTSRWNQAYWVGSTNTYQAFVGVSGLGYYGSVTMKIRGTPGTLLTSCHVMFEPGGLM
jgi:hypothetical protein